MSVCQRKKTVHLKNLPAVKGRNIPTLGEALRIAGRNLLTFLKAIMINYNNSSKNVRLPEKENSPPQKPPSLERAQSANAGRSPADKGRNHVKLEPSPANSRCNKLKFCGKHNHLL